MWRSYMHNHRKCKIIWKKNLLQQNVKQECVSAVIKKCVLNTVSDLVGKGNRRATKPYITEETVTWMKEKMSTMKEELHKTEDGLKRATNDAMRNNLSICDNIWNYKQQDVMT